MNIIVTEKAVGKLIESGVGEGNFLRLGVQAGGCAGMSYAAYIDEIISARDEVIFEQDTLRIIAGKEYLHLIDGLNIDFSDDLVHERLIVDGEVGQLTGTLMHESFGSLEQVLEKVNRYSSLSAEQMNAQGRRGGVATAVLHGIGAFFRTYVLRAGFLDGREGFMLAVSNAEGAYYKYVKLFLLNRRR